MAGEFMAAAMKACDLIGAGPDPMAGPLIDQPAGDIKGPPRIVRLENGSADGGGALGNVVEGKADHRASARQLKRRGTQMPGQPVADARSQC